MHKAFSTLLLLSLGMTSCKVGPKYEPPVMEIPCEWKSQPCAGLCAESPEDFSWWESFNDPLLNSLIARAAENNLDMGIAATRILAARRELKGKAGDSLPHVDASAACGHVYYSKQALVKGLLGRDDGVKRNVNFFELGFDAEWEIDLFGLREHEANALRAKLEASEENLNDVWVTLSAEVARNYLSLRGFQKRLEVLHKNIESQKNTLELTDELLDIGMSDSIAQLQVQQQLSTMEAQEPLLLLSIEKSIYRLSILLGEEPGNLYCELIEIRPLPELPVCKPIGLPSDLLRRRPDIRKAERELAAATEKVGSAIAGLFPRLSLRGFVGDISTLIQSLFTPASAIWMAGPQLLVPVFNSKLLVEDVVMNKIRTTEALYQYKKTVLLALEESENAIASFHYEWEKQQSLERAMKCNLEALNQSSELYERGLKDYLTVLTISRSFFETEEAYLQSKIDMLLHYVSIYKAIGGGWDLAECDVIMPDCDS